MSFLFHVELLVLLRRGCPPHFHVRGVAHLKQDLRGRQEHAQLIARHDQRGEHPHVVVLGCEMSDVLLVTIFRVPEESMLSEWKARCPDSVQMSII